MDPGRVAVKGIRWPGVFGGPALAGGLVLALGEEDTRAGMKCPGAARWRRLLINLTLSPANKETKGTKVGLNAADYHEHKERSAGSRTRCGPSHWRDDVRLDQRHIEVHYQDNEALLCNNQAAIWAFRRGGKHRGLLACSRR